MHVPVSLFFAALTLAATGSGGAIAQSYPVKPVKIVSMATGVADGLTRMMTQKMTEAMGQPVVVEPQPGAGGTIGADQIARSAPDGYSLFVSYPDPLVLRALMVKQVPYDTLRDFTPITMMIEAQIVLAANPSVSASNLRELIDFARANPGKLSYGSNGIGTSFQMAGEALKQHAGLNILHVPREAQRPHGRARLAPRGDIPIRLIACAVDHRASRVRARHRAAQRISVQVLRPAHAVRLRNRLAAEVDVGVDERLRPHVELFPGGHRRFDRAAL